MRVDRIRKGKTSKEAAAMCYSYKDRRMEEEARRKLWEKEARKRREQEKERQAKKDRELVKA
jgi:hypothetical protein